MKVRIKKLHKDAVIPRYAKAGDAGMDLVAVSRVFDKDGNAAYGTGLAFEIPEGYVGLVFPRSSNAKKDLLLGNAVGVIDSGYRGEVTLKFKPCLVYVDRTEDGLRHGKHSEDYEGSDRIELATQAVTFHGRTKDYPDVAEGTLPFMPRVYEVGDRIGQIIILPYPHVEFEEAEELSETERGDGGYGSTGV